MVWFQCDDCGDSLKKVMAKHFMNLLALSCWRRLSMNCYFVY